MKKTKKLRRHDAAVKAWVKIRQKKQRTPKWRIYYWTVSLGVFGVECRVEWNGAEESGEWTTFTHIKDCTAGELRALARALDARLINRG
ncbi:MAG TPA: hypothetical protein VGP72_14640 [Planctomycetota bacterium]|jgi:hypothetical protein